MSSIRMKPVDEWNDLNAMRSTSRPLRSQPIQFHEQFTGNGTSRLATGMAPSKNVTLRSGPASWSIANQPPNSATVEPGNVNSTPPPLVAALQPKNEPLSGCIGQLNEELPVIV